MKRKGWIIADIIISIAIILIFSVSLNHIYKAIHYHVDSDETNQRSVEVMEASINYIMETKIDSFPMIINDENVDIIVNKAESNNDNVQKLSVEIRQKNGDFIHNFYLYKEAEDEI